MTTRFFNGSTQTESLLEVPNLSHNSITSYRTTYLPNNGGTETEVDVETFSGGKTPLSGTVTTHSITTTLPGGSTQSEVETYTVSGRKTVIVGTLHQAGGGVQTWSMVNIKHGSKSSGQGTITQPDGTMVHQWASTTSRGHLDSTSITTTTQPGEYQESASATSVIRVRPPAS